MYLTSRRENKEKQKLKEYLGHARVTKRLWDIKVTMIPIVNGALGTVPKNLIKRFDELLIRERVKII